MVVHEITFEGTTFDQGFQHVNDNLWSSKFELVRVGRWFLKGVQSLFGSRIRAQLTSNNSLQFHPIEFPCFLSFYKMSDPFLIDESRIQVWRNSIPNCFVVRAGLLSISQMHPWSLYRIQHSVFNRLFAPIKLGPLRRKIWENQTQTTESLSGLYSSIFQK